MHPLFTRRTLRNFLRVGQANDAQQLKILGRLCLALSCFVMLILLIPNSLKDRLGVLFVSGFIAVVGFLLNFAGRRHVRMEACASAITCDIQPTELEETSREKVDG